MRFASPRQKPQAARGGHCVTILHLSASLRNSNPVAVAQQDVNDGFNTLLVGRGQRMAAPDVIRLIVWRPGPDRCADIQRTDYPAASPLMNYPPSARAHSW